MPTYLSTDSLTDPNYAIETKMTVREVSINITLGWIPTRAWQDDWLSPDEITVEFLVWKNDELIDTKEIMLSSEDQPPSENFQKSYTATP